MLLTPCSIKASIHKILEIENVHQSKNSQVKINQNNSNSCSIIKVETIKKSIKNLDIPNFDLPESSILFIGLAHSSLNEEEINSNEIQPPKIPFYLLYKRLKYSLIV